MLRCMPDRCHQPFAAHGADRATKEVEGEPDGDTRDAGYLRLLPADALGDPGAGGRPRTAGRCSRGSAEDLARLRCASPAMLSACDGGRRMLSLRRLPAMDASITEHELPAASSGDRPRCAGARDRASDEPAQNGISRRPGHRSFVLWATETVPADPSASDPANVAPSPSGALPRAPSSASWSTAPASHPPDTKPTPLIMASCSPARSTSCSMIR